MSQEISRDAVVERNRQLLLQRSDVGIDKYGTTLADSGLDRRAILQHALEEALDLANYLQTEIMRFDAEQAIQRQAVLVDDAMVDRAARGYLRGLGMDEEVPSPSLYKAMRDALTDALGVSKA